LVTRLAVVSHTPHHRTDDGLVGWGPTVTELDHLAGLVDELVHVAPVHDGPAPPSALPYAATNVRVEPVRAAGGDGLAAKAGLAAAVPGWTAAIRRGIDGAYALHVRCPANLSGVALAWLRLGRDRRPCWVKYAGTWRPEGPEPASYRVQRQWLHRGFGRVAVTVNGTWPDDPPHVRAFPNPSLTDDDLAAGRRRTAAKRPLQDGLALAFVGRVETEKGAVDAVDVAAGLAARGLECTLTVVGDGPALEGCRARAAADGVAATFLGWVDREAVHDVLGRAHVLLLPSRASEGWPKVLSEAMAFGAVPVASAVSAIPQTFAHTGAGIVVEGGPEAYVETVAALAADPDRLAALRAAGLAAAPSFGFSAWADHVRALFRDRWGLELA
jgi:glycosyltransferase involved in cell wall biosynthesis